MMGGMRRECDTGHALSLCVRPVLCTSNIVIWCWEVWEGMTQLGLHMCECEAKAAVMPWGMRCSCAMGHALQACEVELKRAMGHTLHCSRVRHALVRRVVFGFAPCGMLCTHSTMIYTVWCTQYDPTAIWHDVCMVRYASDMLHNAVKWIIVCWGMICLCEMGYVITHTPL